MVYYMIIVYVKYAWIAQPNTKNHKGNMILTICRGFKSKLSVSISLALMIHTTIYATQFPHNIKLWKKHYMLSTTKA